MYIPQGEHSFMQQYGDSTRLVAELRPSPSPVEDMIMLVEFSVVCITTLKHASASTLEHGDVDIVVMKFRSYVIYASSILQSEGII